MTQALVCWKQKISIHALREEGDLYFMALYYNHDDISIHALREEGDRKNLALRLRRRVFLSTPSARRATFVIVPPTLSQSIFLSTPSARRATHEPPPQTAPSQISIHALREEGDATGT